MKDGGIKRRDRNEETPEDEAAMDTFRETVTETKRRGKQNTVVEDQT